METSNLYEVTADSIVLNIESPGQKAIDWVSENSADIQQRLATDGALLIRGLNILSSKQFAGVLTRMFEAELLDYAYRSTPRTGLRGNVYTATEYHADQSIPQHNENAYSNRWPMRIGFLCMVPAATGGETPIADSRVVYQRIPREIREEFEARKVMYVRNYGDIDLPWEVVFQTKNKQEVERYCQQNNLEFEWRANNRLRTRQVNPAVAVHPVSGETLWFNQAHLFHLSNLAPAERASMLLAMSEDEVPRNTFFGDGAAIDPQMLDEIRQVYAATQLEFSWQKNDFLLLDNMLFSHGRKPFSGERKVLVGMAIPHEHN